MITPSRCGQWCGEGWWCEGGSGTRLSIARPIALPQLNGPSPLSSLPVRRCLPPYPPQTFTPIRRMRGHSSVKATRVSRHARRVGSNAIPSHALTSG